MLLYDYYHLFSVECKKILDRFIFRKVFYEMFLHWCGYVRKSFYYLLEHRLAVKFKEYENMIN